MMSRISWRVKTGDGCFMDGWWFHMSTAISVRVWLRRRFSSAILPWWHSVQPLDGEQAGAAIRKVELEALRMVTRLGQVLQIDQNVGEFLGSQLGPFDGRRRIRRPHLSAVVPHLLRQRDRVGEGVPSGNRRPAAGDCGIDAVAGVAVLGVEGQLAAPGVAGLFEISRRHEISEKVGGGFGAQRRPDDALLSSSPVHISGAWFHIRLAMTAGV